MCLQNRILTRDAIAYYEVGTREFNSIFFQEVFAYPTCFMPRPMELRLILIMGTSIAQRDLILRPRQRTIYGHLM